MARTSGKQEPQPSAPTASVREGGQASPVTILALALAGGIGYFAWRLWKKRQTEADGTAGSSSEEVSDGAAVKGKAKSSSFTFDRPNRPAASTSGQTSTSAAATSSSSANSHSRSRRDAPKPKSQKQLRKEAKQAKKAARDQAARDAENTQLAAAIAKRAKEVGLGQQPPEQQKQYYVDYEGVARGYDKIVEWQNTGKKKY